MWSKIELHRVLLKTCGLFFMLIVGIFLLAACDKDEPQEAVITIDPDMHYQTIVGWEATAQAGQDFASFPEFGPKLLFSAVNELGINRLRLEVRSGSENGSDVDSPGSGKKRYEIVNDNDDPFVINDDGFHFTELDAVVEQVVIPMRKLSTERGDTLLINLNYVDFGPSDFEHKDHPEEYAEFILAVFLHMKDKYGFVPDTLEVILEPDTDSANWTATQIADAIVATSRRLKGKGFAPGFVTPSTTDAAQAVTYIDEIAAVPGAMNDVVEFSYHRYSGATDEVLKAIAERASLHSKHTSMLEWIGADHHTLHKDLKLANVSAWQQYTLAYSGRDNGGAYYKIDSESLGPAIRMGRRTRLLRQYFNCLRPGMVRVEAASSNSNFDPIAFEKTEGTASVVIKADLPGNISVRGLQPGRYSVSYTTDDSAVQPDTRVIAPGEDLTVSIPSAGVLTICGEQ